MFSRYNFFLKGVNRRIGKPEKVGLNFQLLEKNKWLFRFADSHTFASVKIFEPFLF